MQVPIRLRVSELVGATLGDIRTDEHGDHWLHLVGKGSRPGKVALLPLARTALDQYLVQRRLPVTTARWDPKTPLVANLDRLSYEVQRGTRAPGLRGNARARARRVDMAA